MWGWDGSLHLLVVYRWNEFGQFFLFRKVLCLCWTWWFYLHVAWFLPFNTSAFNCNVASLADEPRTSGKTMVSSSSPDKSYTVQAVLGMDREQRTTEVGRNDSGTDRSLLYFSGQGRISWVWFLDRQYVDILPSGARGHFGLLAMTLPARVLKFHVTAPRTLDAAPQPTPKTANSPIWTAQTGLPKWASLSDRQSAGVAPWEVRAASLRGDLQVMLAQTLVLGMYIVCSCMPNTTIINKITIRPTHRSTKHTLRASDI